MRKSKGGSAQDSAPIRVLLLEDEASLRERFADILRAWPGAELVGACACLAEARQVLLHGQRVDLLMADLQLPDGHGTEAIRLLQQVNPAADSMVISVLADEASVIDAIEAGAVGYLLKDAGSIELVDAIQELRAGRSPISSSIARILVRRMNANGMPRDDEGLLTPREIEILWGIAKGYTYAELAERLGISRNTVPAHIKNIYRKLAANNRSEAVFEATRRGLIRFGPV